MTPTHHYLTEVPGGIRISIKVVPNASRTEISGFYGENLKIRVSQPPEGGKANRAVQRLLAEISGTAQRNVTLVQGETQTRKVFLIAEVSCNSLEAALTKRLAASNKQPQT